jgi:hypothetical protein
VKALLVVVLLAAGAVLAYWRGWVQLPPAWDPWAPLDVREAPNWLTAYKLSRLQADPALCDQALATSGLRYVRQADSPANAKCPLQNVIRVQGGDTALSSSFVASCPLAVALALFERHQLQPAAQRIFAQPVTQIDHLGSYACRNVYNRSSGRLSQHASANALDVAGFRLADGRRISVLADWNGVGDKALFLRQVSSGACRSFNTVLGPEYNAAHRNHLHLDMGRWSMCR